MDALEVRGLEANVKALSLRKSKSLWDALVIRMKAENAGDDRLVRAVTAVCLCEGARQVNVSAHRQLAEDGTCHEAEPHGASGMRARRPDHDRTDDVKNAMHRVARPPFEKRGHPPKNRAVAKNDCNSLVAVPVKIR